MGSLKSESRAGTTYLRVNIEMSLLLLVAMLFCGSRARDNGYHLQVQPVVWAQRGLCVFVPCNFKNIKESWLNSYTYGYWFRQYNNSKEECVATNHHTEKVSPSTQRRFQLVGNPKDGNCSLLITDVQKRDQGMYYFKVDRFYSTSYSFLDSKVSLEVTEQTQPDVYILEPLWPNRWGTVICMFNGTFDGCPPPSFSWKGPVLVTSRSPFNIHQYSVLKILPQHHDEGTTLTCSVRFSPRGVVLQKTVRLDVAHAPKNLVIRVSQDKGAAPLSHVGAAPSFHLQAQKGSFLQLLCEASSHPPASLSWSVGDRVLLCSNPKDPQALALELPSVQEGDGGSYTCRAENLLGLEMREVHLEVQHAPEDLTLTASIENRTVLRTIQKTSTLRVLRGQSLQLRCVAHSNPTARLSWTRGALPQRQMLPTELGLLLLPQIQPDKEGEFTCQAQNQLGSQQASVTISVYSPLKLLGPHCSWEAQALRCNCSAHGWPVPALHWWLGPELLPGNCSEASIQLSSSDPELWVNSSLSLLRELDTGLRLSCEAWNMHGAQNSSILLLPDEKGTMRGAFSNGILVGTGILGLLCLSVILILRVISLRRRGKQKEQLSRGSTILDYINIFPRLGSQAQDQEVELNGPSQPSPPDPYPKPRKNPKQKQNPQEKHCAGSHADAIPSLQALQEDEVQYSHLHFPGRSPRVFHTPNNSHEEYVEVRIR